MNKAYVLIIVVCMAFFPSCKQHETSAETANTSVNSCDRFIGTWKYGGMNVVISKESQLYFFQLSYMGQSAKYAATCENAYLRVQGNGNDIVSFSGNSILYRGKELSKIK